MNAKTTAFQKGFTLTEALVAFAITAVGLLAIVSFQAELFTQSADSKARSEALALAEQKLEEFKHYTFAEKNNFVDENNDGVMDADGNYADNAIVGQHAQYTRSWTITSTDNGKQIDVNVSWIDATNRQQSVDLTTELTWISPRSGVDLLVELEDGTIVSPTGRAKIGEGNLADYPAGEISLVDSQLPNGLSTYRHKENLLLVDGQRNVLLTLLEACSTSTGICTDFVRISGTVYLDKTNTGTDIQLSELNVLASDAAYCERFVPSGNTLDNPPQTTNGNYEFFYYTCYIGGGWHGNIGFVAENGLKQSYKICQGDPNAIESYNGPVIALRRAYRGVLSKTYAGETLFISHGIKDATVLTGHDYVFTILSTSQTEGSYCIGADAPMTRTDSSGGRLFAGVPTDFVCLNDDDNGDGFPDYLDAYDTSLYTARISCPYDPTDPPVSRHIISGIVTVADATADDVATFMVNTSDGPGNCTIETPFVTGLGGLQANYTCDVYDWGTGWTGFISAQPNTNLVYCDNSVAGYSDLGADTTLDFSCRASAKVVIQGTITPNGPRDIIDTIAIAEDLTGEAGSCAIADNVYKCVAPYTGLQWDGSMKISSASTVCGSAGNVFSFTGLTSALSPYRLDLYVTSDPATCPLVVIE